MGRSGIGYIEVPGGSRDGSQDVRGLVGHPWPIFGFVLQSTIVSHCNNVVKVSSHIVIVGCVPAPIGFRSPVGVLRCREADRLVSKAHQVKRGANFPQEYLEGGEEGRIS